MKLDRRNFLKGAATGALSFAGMKIFTPHAAQAQAGTGKNLIFIYANGGMDGLGAYPYVRGPIRDLFINGSGAINPLRPYLSFVYPGDPLTQIDLDNFRTNAVTSTRLANAQSGLPNEVALHPAWAPLLETGANKPNAGDNIKIIKGVGTLSFVSASHETMQKYLSMLDTSPNAASRRGWTARAADTANLPSFAFWGLCSCGDLPYFNTTSSARPIVLNSLNEMEYRNRNNIAAIGASDGNDDNRYTRQLALDLLSGGSSNPVEQTFRTGMAQVPVTKSIVDSIETIPTVGTYTNRGSNFYNNCRATAQLLTYKQSDANLRNRPMIVYMERGGFDTHDNQLTALQGAINDYAVNLSGLIADLRAANVWQNTVILIMSEFGRTTRQNSLRNTVGTDHAHGSNVIAIGGSVNGGAAGSDILMSELTNMNRNHFTPNVAFETPVGAALQWVGINPASVIPTYSASAGNALQLFL